MGAIRKYKVIDGPDGHRGVYHGIPTADDGVNQRISWGEPAQLAQVQFDRCCPQCGAVRGPGYIRQDGTVQLGDLDLGIEGGRVFGARCPCGWSF